jgi:hypothetical protein
MIVTSACKPKNEQTKTGQLETPVAAKLDVSFKVVPEQPVPNMAPTLQATVKQNDKPVTDASVDLEVWKDGMKTHQMIKATHSQDGTYTAESTLKDAGDYNVKVHVTTPSGMEQTADGTFSVKKKRKCCEGH